jgi:LysR family transcriptional regulator AphB
VVETQVAGRFCANTAQALLEAALAGLGIALLPAVMTSSHLRAEELTEVLPDHGVDGREAYLVYLSRRQLPRAVSAFVDFMMAKMVDEGLVRPVSAHRASG